MILPPDAARALELIATTMAGSVDPWWVIGSIAVALHDVDPGPVRDIDLLVSERDASCLLDHGVIALAEPTPDARFRSALFARWSVSPFPVELMADLKVITERGVVPIRPTTRQPIAFDGASIFIPEAAELCEILHTFGRPKDLERASLLLSGSRRQPSN